MKPTSFLIFIFSFLFIHPNSFGQSGVIMGKITDHTTGEAITFANITVMKNDSVLDKTVSDSEGNYSFSLKNGKYNLKIIFVGYQQEQVNDIPVKNDTIVLNRKLKHSTALSEVEVVEYAIPLIAPDATSTGSTYKVDGIKIRGISSIAASSAGLVSKTSRIIRETETTQFAVKAGTLTAGEINDFSKWELWKDISENDLNSWQKYWQMKPEERYAVQVLNNEGKPMVDCEVQLLNRKDEVVWKARTDNTGKAELWANVFSKNENEKPNRINAIHQGQSFSIKGIQKFHEGINKIKISSACDISSQVDVMFIVDATGSMGDEINYLKEELNDVIQKVKENHSELKINLGTVFYRDKGDEYVTRKGNFSSDISQTVGFIKQQNAGGGGDTPEAMDSALVVAINEMNWSENAIARLLFLVLDAPPHYNPETIQKLEMLTRTASAKGIRIIPITGSGIDKSTEYLMRSFALSTNGTYVFLTDHSRVGNPHIIPTTDEYDVFLLNELLVRLFYKFTQVPPCNGKFSVNDSAIKDTMFVFNPKIVAHVVADSSKIKPVVFVDTAIKIDTGNIIGKIDSVHSSDTTQLNPSFKNFKYYPNPTSGKLFVEIDGSIEELFLADVSGKILQRYKINNQPKLEVNLNDLAQGIYFLQYWSGKKWLAGKVILAY